MDKRLRRSFLLLLMCFAVFFAGCSNSGPAETKLNNETQASGTEPVTLKIYQYGLAINDLDFENFFVKPAKQKFPNITLELVKSVKGSTPEELLAAGAFPDIIFASVPVINDLKRLHVLSDLNGLVKSNKTSLSKFDPTAMEAIKLFGDKGELYALPFSSAYGALFYNKDIFDKFGISYPKDGMDWEQAADLARKVAREADGMQYRGFEPGDMRVFGHALSLQFIDPVTLQATLNNESWKRVLQKIQDIYNIPNNRPPENEFNAI